MDNVQEKIINSAEFQDFLSFAKQNKIENKEGQPYILLEGFLHVSRFVLLNTYLGILANKQGYNVAFIAGSDGNTQCNIAYKALGAEPIYLSELQYKKSFIQKIISKLKRELRKSLLQKDLTNLLNFKEGTVNIGAYVYDTVIRVTPNVFTISQAQYQVVVEKLEQAVEVYYKYKSLLSAKNIKYIVLSHKFYINYGILGRVGIENGASILSIFGGLIKEIKDEDFYMESDTKVTPEILERLYQLPKETILNFISKRFSGEVLQHDVYYAYQTKREYEDTEVYLNLKLDKDKPIGLIMTHAFSDVPHCTGFSIYLDYYDWFVKTLELIKDIPQVQWLIKPHPASVLYEEVGVVEEVIKAFPHIQLVPNDIKPTSLFRISDAVVTVRGTAGAEALLFDNQIILAGASPYDSLGLTINCKNEQGYKSTLSQIQKKYKRTETELYKAQCALYWITSNASYSDDLIGSGMPPNLSNEVIFDTETNNYKQACHLLKMQDWQNHVFIKNINRIFLKNNSNSLSVFSPIA
ncbi:hypothetical protein [Hugenholtzia roseola]|uniref:capsular polysaccharide export protein, LipB/KpsS family n=1 Tax=Hugenholtzia roseola TaxID=1002 RepID=UPI00041BCD58|nr:hypothetical protein [Hugenholtzia roseola]